MLHDDVLKLVHYQNIGNVPSLSNYLGIYPSCLSSDNSGDDSDISLRTEEKHGEKRKTPSVPDVEVMTDKL